MRAPAAIAAGLLAASLAIVSAACSASAPPPAQSASHPPPASPIAASPTATPAAPRATPAAPRATPAAPGADLQAAVDALRERIGAPGALGVLVEGDARAAAVSGHGDLDGRTTLGDDTRFRIGSVTKPIVAALVLTAVDRGELALDAVVGDLLPGVLRAEPPVTVRQLLDHTSGIFDEGNEGDPLDDIARIADPAIRTEAERVARAYRAGTPVVAPARLLVALAETHDRYFAPGTGYHYSNINYELAGMVLEHATGRTLAALLDDRVVRPLGLARTSLAPADATSPEMRGYESTSGETVDLTDDLAYFGNGGHGGIVSTADEVLEMLRATVGAELFPRALVTDMETPVRESYGLGLATYALRCGTFFGHGGQRERHAVDRDGVGRWLPRRGARRRPARAGGPAPHRGRRIPSLRGRVGRPTPRRGGRPGLPSVVSGGSRRA